MAEFHRRHPRTTIVLGIVIMIFGIFISDSLVQLWGKVILLIIGLVMVALGVPHYHKK